MSGALRAASDAVVRAALEALLARAEAPASQRVAAMTREPFRFESSATIDRLGVTLADGSRLDLLVKDLSAAGLRPEARRLKPTFVHDPAREALVYEQVLAPAAAGTPRCLGAIADGATGRSWLVLEHVDAPTLADEGDVEDWAAAARWIARLQHATTSAPPLLTRGAAWHARWLARALTHLEAREHPGAHALSARLRAAGGTLVRDLGRLPRAFCHGELYPANVLLRRDGVEPEVVVVDWELAGVGPSTFDLAALCGGAGWSPEQRRALCAAYAEEAAALGGDAAPSVEELEAGVALCRLALALQWLGWAEDWTPPDNQGNDWLAEAQTLLDEREAA